MNREKQVQAHRMEPLMRMVLGGLLALVVCLFVLGVGAFAVSKGWLPAEVLAKICLAGCVLGGFCGGLLALRGKTGKTLLIGLGTGIVFFLFLLLAGVILYRNIAPLETGWGLLAAGLIGGALARSWNKTAQFRKTADARRCIRSGRNLWTADAWRRLTRSGLLSPESSWRLRFLSFDTTLR